MIKLSAESNCQRWTSFPHSQTNGDTKSIFGTKFSPSRDGQTGPKMNIMSPARGECRVARLEDLGKLLDVALVEGEGLGHGGLAIVGDLGFAHAAHLDGLAGPGVATR